MGSEDERFMARALDNARRAPFTSPNPHVGAVVVRDGGVVGEGWHEGPGTAHAEIAAIAGRDVTGATLYVNLEPCSHAGRTPPCAPALAAAGIARVVTALEDPDPRVRGSGTSHLRAAGVEVDVGVLADEARRVNAPYLHHRATGRSFLSLKLALTLDGRMSARDGSSRWITGEATRGLVHRRRLEADAVMVGSGTVGADDPRLTARADPAPRQPTRVVVDGSGTTSPKAALFRRDAPVLVATTDGSPVPWRRACRDAGAEVLVLDGAPEGVALRPLLEELGSRDLVEVLCEGGARLATSLLREDLVDRLEIHFGPLLTGAGGAAIGDLGVRSMRDAGRWFPSSLGRCEDDVLVELERGWS